MSDFEFSVTAGGGAIPFHTTASATTLSGTLGAGGPAFTFSIHAPFAVRSGDNIVLGGSNFVDSFVTHPVTGGLINVGVTKPISWSGNFEFTDPSLWFSNFAINGTFPAGAMRTIKTTGGATSAGTIFAPYTGNVVSFTVSGVGDFLVTLNSISADAVNCFCTGTRIATPDGFTAVEMLKPNDTILTAAGGKTTVKWLGYQNVDTRLVHPARVNPICICAGALANNIPDRDLLLSSDHAIALDGCLINAGALVNGTTIYQVDKMPMDGFTYYHIETEAHELLLAEGVAAESFIDYAGRDSFGNNAEATRSIPEMDLPRISSARLVPA